MYNLIRISCLSLIFGFQFLNAQYANGIIISNEGNFGAPNADVSYIDHATQQISNNIYQAVNNEPLGDILQNIGLYGDKAYLVLNNSNKIVVVDRTTFVKIGVITEHISLPRYIDFANDKIYVSNSSNNSVSVYNIADRSFVTKIENLGTVEEIEVSGNHVFVQNGSFSSGNSITVIDATTDTLVSIIDVESGINGIVANGDYLYAISSGSNYTHLYKFNAATQSLVNDLRTTDIASGGKISYSDGQLYFTGNNLNIYKIAEDLVNNPNLVLTVPDNSWSTLYGFGVVNNYILTADANGFTAASIIKVYNKTTGAEIVQRSAGIGSNGFYGNFGDDLGLNDVDFASNEIVIYPNPMQNEFYIKGVDTARVQIYNALGMLVKSSDYNGGAIYISELRTGLYFVSITTVQGVIKKKILVK